ncbi:hypothetical protein TELCIR_00121 [Teladorsagia circumcincta]|uniref:Conserved Oligomeric Golgi complex subunit 6 C-terminal domain-containing protein n=1 Tax=Teladorsagia circumcincta TaxID=45464 RepID=A0A2G9V5D4_TELCI|nr:hypothetical protein TELCIR_00121 [Teladorsagia circumcincta]
MKAVLCQSFAALQEREVLLKYALDEVCTARKNQILRLYIDALTKGTHSNGKPIELMSHDPLRPQIGSDSELARTVEELNQLTLNIFYSGLNGAVQKILSKMGAPDYDLLPVSAVHQILMLLRDVLETHDGAIASRQNAEEEFNKIFSCVLDPLYRSVQVAATHLHSPLDVAVYTLNCLSAIYSLVILYPFTDSRLEMIKALMEGNEDVLVSEEASAILANTGLISLYQKAAAHDRNQGPLSAIPGMDASTVNQTLSQFDVYLSQPDNYQLDQVSKISSVRTRESVQQRTIDNVVAAYSVVVSKLEDPFNAYKNVAFKSVEQVPPFKLSIMASFCSSPSSANRREHRASP